MWCGDRGGCCKGYSYYKSLEPRLVQLRQISGLRRGKFINPDYSGPVFGPIYNLAMSIHPFTQKKIA